MIISLSKTTMVLGLLTIVGTQSGASSYRTPAGSPSPSILMIRVSQESSMGRGDFDSHILGFVRALQTTGTASDFYEYGRAGENYGNTEPMLTPDMSQVFFVNASDGLALFVVNSTSNQAERSSGGAVKSRWELSGGTSKVLLSDDNYEAVESDGGTVFTCDMAWGSENTDGMAVGALPVGFTLFGQFLKPPVGVDNGWVVISADGSRIALRPMPGQRVRLDVALHVRVRQDH